MFYMLIYREMYYPSLTMWFRTLVYCVGSRSMETGLRLGMDLYLSKAHCGYFVP